MDTHTLETLDVDLTFDVFGPLPTADGRPPLVMIGQLMEASGLSTSASCFPDRTVITYDPRGLGRSTRKDSRIDNVPEVQTADVHGLIQTGAFDIASAIAVMGRWGACWFPVHSRACGDG